MEEFVNSMSDIDLSKVSPLINQYISIKNQYSDCILFYRLGDFYEMFFDDAITTSRELELTLTGKNCGLDKRAAMCGIPFHAYEMYITKLVEKGYRVAICEQVEDPALAKGLVKRDVIRIVTPGTNIVPEALDEKRNNFLMCIEYEGSVYGIALIDVSTGEFLITQCETASGALDELIKYEPSEVVCNKELLMSGFNFEYVKNRYMLTPNVLPDRLLSDNYDSILKHFNKNSLEELGIAAYEAGASAATYLLNYLFDTQKNNLEHITRITPYVRGKYMIIDNSTRRNLELFETMRDKNRRGSLLWVMDKSKTAMGGRLIRNFIEQPLLDKDLIEERLDCVEELKNDMINREELREYLSSIYDLERLAGRICYRNAGPRDLVAFASSLSTLPAIKSLISDYKSKLLNEVHESLDTLQDLHELITTSIVDEPPLTVKEGGIIKTGYNEEVDKLRNAKTEGKNWLAELEARERDNTGIKNLKIKYNRVFGYYFEVTNSFKSLVPAEWIRKQTLAGAERYTTGELQDLEDKILHAQDRLFALEFDIFYDIREKITENIERIQRTAACIAQIDAFASIAYVAEHNGYVRPSINTKGQINIIEGRHPVVEQFIGKEQFICNDAELDNKDNRIVIITGPNMAGKSTYMRQTALIVLMAQCGFYVPASSAVIGLVDRIFTRVGASDDLSTGQSTFMVEMNEVAEILKNATSKSLLILDEIGRGTSTFDGLSIAWAVVEHINDKKLLGAKTLFATHYHELTELEGKLDSVKNYSIAVKEQGEDIIFLRKIIRGGADKSYGIQVARLAGLPDSVLSRAKEIVNLLTDNDINQKVKTSDISVPVKKKEKPVEDYQFSFFDKPDYSDIIDRIKDLKTDEMTPIECLNILNDIKKQILDKN